MDSLIAGELTVKALAGEIELAGVEADTALVYCQFGNVGIEDSRIKDLNLEVKMGDFYGDKLICGGLVADIYMGNVDIDGRLGNKTEIAVSSGNVDLTLTGLRSNYSINAAADKGDVRLNGDLLKNDEDHSADNQISLNVKTGDIDVRFEK